ncbi:Rz-like spanin [Enterobacter phage phiEap-2]|uniref:Rz-like spanin n=1 Tax=Enterobacter phage phiEap-2 TaxID=1701257 RepID=UPI0006BC4154|nr:Rz-like spanin [Enterobacter phage phiEap-2]ALA45593.1 putative spanin [Enterobacter phage phiEap-2]
MNLTYRLYIAAALVVALAFVGWRLYSSGWNNGRAALVAEQQAKARAQLAKQTTRQQANDSKAAAADDEGKAKTVTITQEVIRYVKTPGRNVCTFDADRLSIKSAAVDNANAIPGYDDTAVQTSAAVGQR